MLGFESAESMAVRGKKEGGKLQDAGAVATAHSAVIDVLKSGAQRKAMSAAQIAEALRTRDAGRAFDLRDEPEVEQMLKENAWVRVELDEEGERLYKYVPRLENVVDLASMTARVESEERGVDANELRDCYEDAADDLERAIVSGLVIAVQHATDKKVTVFPRGETYLVALKARATGAVDEANTLGTTESCVDDIRRGDAVRVGATDEWRRVSSRVNRSAQQPVRAERPLSVSAHGPLHSGNQYCDPFDDARLSVWPDIDTEALRANDPAGVSLWRHGVTNDLRALWAETAAAVPSERPDVQAKLAQVRRSSDTRRRGSMPGGAARRKRPNETRWLGAAHAKAKRQEQQEKAANEPKRRKFQNNRFLRLTNTHLVGTEIGHALARADERTKHLYKDDPGQAPSGQLGDTANHAAGSRS